MKTDILEEVPFVRGS